MGFLKKVMINDCLLSLQHTPRPSAKFAPQPLLLRFYVASNNADFSCSFSLAWSPDFRFFRALRTAAFGQLPASLPESCAWRYLAAWHWHWRFKKWWKCMDMLFSAVFPRPWHLSVVFPPQPFEPGSQSLKVLKSQTLEERSSVGMP